MLHRNGFPSGFAVRRRVALASVVAGSLAAAAVACSTTPTTPAAVTPPTPPVVVNTPPVIQSLVIGNTRAEANQPVVLQATVKDAETPVDQLQYVWSASPANGSFVGSGSTVTWYPPAGQKSPDTSTVTLTVTENYTSAGQPQKNVVSSSGQVHYNDSRAETVAISSQFLADFGTFSVSPQQCVRNFSDSCSGKTDEFNDITYERANYHILSSTFTATDVSFNGTFTTGTVQGPCTFEDIPGIGPNAGRRESVSGICVLKTVYENFRWYLCVSNFLDGTSSPESLKGRVPGQVTSMRLVP